MRGRDGTPGQLHTYLPAHCGEVMVFMSWHCQEGIVGTHMSIEWVWDQKEWGVRLHLSQVLQSCIALNGTSKHWAIFLSYRVPVLKFSYHPTLPASTVKWCVHICMNVCVFEL